MPGLSRQACRSGIVLIAVWPKLVRGGCFTAHNVSGRGAGRGIGEFLSHLKTLPDADLAKVCREAYPIAFEEFIP